MTKPFKMAEALSKQLQFLGPLKHAWFTTFNLNVDFFERHVLSTLLQMDKPRSRIDFELMQQKLNGTIKEGRKTHSKIMSGIDVKVFADQRMYDASDLKRTSIEIYGMNPALLDGGRKNILDNNSLFHPKVIFLQDEEERAILGAGSANLTLNGWSTNQEVFSFHMIECLHQVKAIRAFFEPLFKFHNIEKTIRFPSNLRAEIKHSDWHFVHTFIKNSGDDRSKSLLTHMLEDSQSQTKDLVVWSPYFSEDLAAFIQRLRSTNKSGELKLHLIPDLVENKRIRTRWSSDLLPFITDESVRFYRNPITRDERSELCHAKIWMSKHKLAIGSWNFTTSGSNIVLEGKDVGQVNIEAGVIIENQQPLEQALRYPLDIKEDNFMQVAELSNHALEVPVLLPVDVSVVFDWQTLTYHIKANKLAIELDWQDMELRLPDIEDPVIFSQDVEQSQSTIERKLAHEPKALLTNHAYELVLSDAQSYRGFIVEHNSMMRRVEQFESLDEIFNNLIDGQTLQNNPNASLRSEILGNDHDWLVEQEAGYQAEQAPTPTLSYFRMFQAMTSFEQRVQALKSDRMLEQYAFVVPGCLVEIGEKIRHELAEDANVFNWYMKQEFNLLVEQVEKQAMDRNLKVRLSELYFKGSDRVNHGKDLQKKIGNAKYRKLIKSKCKYVSI